MRTTLGMDIMVPINLTFPHGDPSEVPGYPPTHPQLPKMR